MPRSSVVVYIVDCLSGWVGLFPYVNQCNKFVTKCQLFLKYFLRRVKRRSATENCVSPGHQIAAGDVYINLGAGNADAVRVCSAANRLEFIYPEERFIISSKHLGGASVGCWAGQNNPKAMSALCFGLNLSFFMPVDAYVAEYQPLTLVSFG